MPTANQQVKGSKRDLKSIIRKGTQGTTPLPQSHRSSPKLSTTRTNPQL